MAKLPEQFIIGKGREWLMSSRPDILELPHSHVWSRYTYDAKRFEDRREAKRKARAVGGAVFRFDFLNGKTELIQQKIPEGAVCDSCHWWSGWDGLCRNGASENYRAPTSMNDVCEEWEDKNGRKNKD